MNEVPFRLFGSSFLDHRNVVQTPCGIMYINGWSDWLSYRIDDRVFAYAHHRNLYMWSLSEIKPDGTDITLKGLSLEVVDMRASQDDLKLFNPTTINLISKPHEILLDLVDYTKNIITP